MGTSVVVPDSGIMAVFSEYFYVCRRRRIPGAMPRYSRIDTAKAEQTAPTSMVGGR
jgi:hypothetical protein